MNWNRFAAILLAAVTGLCPGCTAVKPWDRDALAEYGMRPDRDPGSRALREHLWFSRETANGGRTIGGGGCGCN